MAIKKEKNTNKTPPPPHKRKEGGQPRNQNARVWTKEKADKIGRDLLNWISEGYEGTTREFQQRMFLDQYFYLEKKGFPSDVVERLKKTKSDVFNDCLNKAKEIQSIKLRMGGLGKANTAMAIFCLINNHNYSNKFDHTTKGEKMDNKIMIEHKYDFTNDERMSG